MMASLLLSACSSDEATRKSRSGRWTKVDDATQLVMCDTCAPADWTFTA